MRNYMKIAVVIYLVFIHAFVVLALWKTDMLARIQVKLGYELVKNELTPRFYNMLVFQERVDANIADNAVIFIGDSLVEGLAVSAIVPHAVNFGIGQDTTKGVLTRIPRYSSLSRSILVVIAVGLNDLNRRKNDRIVENYREILAILPKGVPVLFSAILPVDEQASMLPGFNNRIQQINRELKAICQSHDRVYFVDIEHRLVDSRGQLSRKYHIGDGVHLNGSGNSIWIAELRAAISSVLSSHNKTEIYE